MPSQEEIQAALQKAAEEQREASERLAQEVADAARRDGGA